MTAHNTALPKCRRQNINSTFGILLYFSNAAELKEFYFRHFGNACTLCATKMKTFKSDNRKINFLFFLGLLFLGLIYFTMTSPSKETKTVWSIFLFFFGILLLGVSLLVRYIVSIENETLIIKNRLKVFSKRINLNNIKRIKIVNKEYPLILHSNTILHLFLWDRKFNRFKQIELFDLFAKKIFIIDGQTIDDSDFAQLVKRLKSLAAHNMEFGEMPASE